ncbi:MAG: hypothetical protein FWJ93_07180 [Micromonosporaceae bacterium]
MAAGRHATVAQSPASHPPVGARWLPRPDSYLLASLAVVAWAVGVVLANTWVGDYQLHVAAVRTLSEDLVSPADPMVGVGEGSPYYSPYVLLAALLVRATGATPVIVLGVFGVLNVVLLLVALRRFVACFSPSPVAATAALAALLLLWGFRSPGWSGFADLYSLAHTLPYPSTFAFALMLLLWERLWRLREGRTVDGFIVFAALAATILLVHPFTAVETGIGAVGLAVGARMPVRAWSGLTAAVAAAVGVVALWPYASVTDLFAAAPALVDIHRPLRAALLDSGSLMCLYALVALPALALRVRRDRLDPLALMFALAAAVVFGALVTGQHHLLRVVPVMMLPPQVAFGVLVGDRDAGPAWARLGSVAAAVVLFLGGLAVSTTPLRGAASAVPAAWLPSAMARDASAPPAGADAERVRGHAAPGAIVLTDAQHTDRRLNLLGYYAVNPGWPNPWIGDEDARAASRARLLDSETTPAERGEIARRYDATCVLITRTPVVTDVGVIDGYQRVDTWGDRGALYCR